MWLRASSLEGGINHTFGTDREGLGSLYRMAGLASLAYAGRYRSMPFKETMEALKRSIALFEDALELLLSDARCMNPRELLNRRLMKRKHYVYGAYLGVLSSFPVLRRVVPMEGVIKAVTAKVAEIVSIKSLDNVNDALHTRERALRSLERQHKAFTSEAFQLEEDFDEIARMENSMYQLAWFTNRLVSAATGRMGPAFQIYLEDFHRYIRGQMSSMDQKADSDVKVDIRSFLSKVNEKGVGRVWVSVDFCFLNSFNALDGGELEAINLVREAIDLIFKGCNVYDDVADLEADLKEGIINSVVYLALDKGLCGEEDLHGNPSSLKAKIETGGGLYPAVQLGDLIFLEGLRRLEKAGDYTSLMDVEGLKFCAHILRLFAMRKWLEKQRNPLLLLKVASPRVSDSIMEYSKYIR
ncbi:MAG: hypothetical protein QW569_02115 [Candidatus Bathyarchaeia archaeon]|nr:hypothetical protein [Candidatus Bathyarchaeota archaeon]